MKILIIIMASALFLSNDLPKEKERWLVEKSSQLIIEGSSNINEFTCKIDSRKRTDTLTIDYDDDGGNIIFIKNKVIINANNFDCGNPLITSDFKKTLKADEYNEITLYFLTLERPTFRNFSSNTVKGKIKIEIAGKAIKYDIYYKIIPSTEGTIKLEGQKKLRISEFNLSPPQKLLGLIQVNEEIEVDFNMLLTPIL